MTTGARSQFPEENTDAGEFERQDDAFRQIINDYTHEAGVRELEARTLDGRREHALERVGDDWWATLVAGVIVALAVADALPKIPW